MRASMELFSLITFHLKRNQLNLIFLFMYSIIFNIFVNLTCLFSLYGADTERSHALGPLTSQQNSVNLFSARSAYYLLTWWLSTTHPCLGYIHDLHVPYF